MLYSHLQFDVHERRAVVVIEPVLCFFLVFCGRGYLAAGLTLPVSFDTKKHSNLSEFCVSVCRIYAVD